MNFIKQNWLNFTDFLKNLSKGTLPAIIVFVFTFVMIGNSSDGIREFFLNIFQMTSFSILILFILYALVSPDKEHEQYFKLNLWWWAVATLMLTLGHF